MEERPQPPAIRASDAERERSVTVLRDAVVEGRLTLEEFSERVGAAQLARTDQELAQLTADLPAAAVARPATAPTVYRATFSALGRSGAWELPAASAWKSWFGTITLDLREVRLAAAEIDLHVFSAFGTTTILVPAGIVVDVQGGGAFATQWIDAPPWPAPADAPRLCIRVSGPGGTLRVRRTEPRSALPQGRPS